MAGREACFFCVTLFPGPGNFAPHVDWAGLGRRLVGRGGFQSGKRVREDG